VTTQPVSLAQPDVLKRVSRGPLPAGSRAPGFTLRSSQYRDARLTDYRGRPLVVVFYVADWHPVCSVQLARYRDIHSELTRLGADILAISSDTVWSHAAFADTHQLSFPLLADDRPRGKIARAYGVFDTRRHSAERALFVIDPFGTIAWSAVFPDAVDPGLDGILTALEGLYGMPPMKGHPA
jgi:peroxiredoxin